MELPEVKDRVQPELLLYAIDRIESMAKQDDPRVSDAIAGISEMLHSISAFFDLRERSFAHEIGLLRQLARLHTRMGDRRTELEFIISGDPSELRFPPLFIFGILDRLIRIFASGKEQPEISIELSGFARMITIQVLTRGIVRHGLEYDSCVSYIRRLIREFEGELVISIDEHPFGCSLCLVGKH